MVVPVVVSICSGRYGCAASNSCTSHSNGSRCEAMSARLKLMYSRLSRSAPDAPSRCRPGEHHGIHAERRNVDARVPWLSGRGSCGFGIARSQFGRHGAGILEADFEEAAIRLRQRQGRFSLRDAGLDALHVEIEQTVGARCGHAGRQRACRQILPVVAGDRSGMDGGACTQQEQQEYGERRRPGFTRMHGAPKGS